MFSCPQCPKLFVTEKGLRSHARAHIRIQNGLYCGICKRTFKSRVYATFHKKQHVLDKVHAVVGVKNKITSEHTKPNKDGIIIKQEPMDTDEQATGPEETDSSAVKNDIKTDFEHVKNSFSDYVIRFDEQKNYFIFYFIDKLEAKEDSALQAMLNTKSNQSSVLSPGENQSAEMKSSQPSELTPDTTRNNAWFAIGDGDKKARGFAVYRCTQCPTFKLRKREILRHQESAHTCRQGYSCTECPAL